MNELPYGLVNEHDALTSCAHCGIELRVSDSAEWALVKDGTCLVEFYHCADKAACTARLSAKLDRHDDRQSER